MSTTDEQPTDEEIISVIDSTGLVCPDVGLAIELVRIGVSMMEAAPVDARDEPYGRITTHSHTGQQFFFRWPEPPYLDNASECVTVYTREPAAPVDARDAQLLKGLRSYLERDRKERFAAGDKRADAAQHFILDIDAVLALPLRFSGGGSE